MHVTMANKTRVTRQLADVLALPTYNKCLKNHATFMILTISYNININTMWRFSIRNLPRT